MSPCHQFLLPRGFSWLFKKLHARMYTLHILFSRFSRTGSLFVRTLLYISICFSFDTVPWNSFCLSTQSGASIFFTAVQYPIVRLCQNLFNHPPSEGLFACSPSVAIINNVAVNNLICTSFCSRGSISVRQIPRLGTAGSKGACIGNFSAERCQMVFRRVRTDLKFD